MKIACPVPSYLLHKSSGQARVQIAGRDIYLGPYGSPESKERYSRLLAELRAAGNELKIFTGRQTVAQITAEYLKHAESYYRKDGRPTKQVGLIHMSCRPLLALYASMPVEEFGPLALKAVREKMIELDWCRRTVNQRIGDIKRLFKWAASNELYPGEKYQALRTVDGLKAGRCEARETLPTGPVAWADVKAVLEKVSPQVAAMIELQYLTGMRPGEVVSMSGRNISTECGPGGQKVLVYRPDSHKTLHHGHRRIVPLGPRARAILEKFMQPDADRFLFAPTEAEFSRNAEKHAARKTPAWPSHSLAARRRRRRARGSRPRPLGECYTTDSYRRAIARACRNAGVKSWHPHQLRHTFASLVRGQFGIETAQVMLGHRTMDATEIYAERDLAKALEVAKKIG